MFPLKVVIFNVETDQCRTVSMLTSARHPAVRGRWVPTCVVGFWKRRQVHLADGFRLFYVYLIHESIYIYDMSLYVYIYIWIFKIVAVNFYTGEDRPFWTILLGCGEQEVWLILWSSGHMAPFFFVCKASMLVMLHQHFIASINIPSISDQYMSPWNLKRRAGYRRTTGYLHGQDGHVIRLYHQTLW